MNDDPSSERMRTHIRAALNEAVLKEEKIIQKNMDNNKILTEKRKAMMQPIILALNSLRDEVKEREEIEFNIWETQCTVEINEKSSRNKMTASVSWDASTYTLSQISEYSFDDEVDEFDYKLKEDIDVVEKIIEMVAQHIAAKKNLRKS